MKWGTAFVELDKSVHDRRSFDCGEAELNTFIRAHAARHAEAGVSRTHVLPSAGVTSDGHYEICAFYTVVPGAIERETLPNQLAKKLPRYPVSVFLLAQLVVYEKCQGAGLGEITLINALQRMWRIGSEMPAYAVVVDCLNDAAASFYLRYGFIDLCVYKNRTRMFLPMKTVAALF